MNRTKIFYFISFSALLGFIFLLDFLFGYFKDIRDYRIAYSSFQSESVPIQTFTKSLLPNLKQSFIDDKNLQNPRRVTTDQYGVLMGPENFKEKALNIVFLGGSTTENNEVLEADRFPYLVSSIIEKKTSNPWNGLNLGIRGHTSRNSLNLYINHPSPYVQSSNYVFVMHNINDRLKLELDGNYNAKIPSYSSNNLRHILNITNDLFHSLWKFLISKSNILFIFDSYLKKIFSNHSGGIVVTEESLDTLPVPSAEKILLFENNLYLLVEVIKTKKSIPILMTQPLGKKSDSQDHFNDVIRKVAKSKNIKLIDLDYESKKLEKRNLLFFSDNIHFNNHGSRWAADIIASNFLKEYYPNSVQASASPKCSPLFSNQMNFVDAELNLNIFPGRYPSFNHSQNRILYQNYDQGISTISTLDVRTGFNEILLSRAGENSIEHPVWFDQTRIIYGTKSDLIRKIHIFNLNSRETEALLPDNLYGAIPDVSPGGQIVFAGYKSINGEFTTPQIYLMNSLNSTPIQLTDGPEEKWRPFFSKKDNSIYYISSTNGSNFGLFRLDIDTRKVTSVYINKEFNVWDPAISSDGAKITFAQKTYSNFDVIISDIPFNGKQMKVKAMSSEDEWDPRFSPDGNYLLYAGTSIYGSQIRAICLK